MSVTLPGAEGMQKMQAVMQTLRTDPPAKLAGIPVARVRDYLNGRIASGGVSQPLDGPKGDLVILDLAEEGNYAAVRPSGTEPKIKFYLFTYTPAEQIADLEDSKAELADRLAAMEADLRAAAG